MEEEQANTNQENQPEQVAEPVEVEREYFVPEHGVTVIATSHKQAVRRARAIVKKKVGDE